MRRTIIGTCLLCLIGCGVDIPLDDAETAGNLGAIDGPTLEFDPSGGVIPFPNNLLLDPTTGKLDLPAQACESPTQTGMRTLILNTLDGFGTYQAGARLTFTEAVDLGSFADRVLYYEIAVAGIPITPEVVPFILQESLTARLDAANCPTGPTDTTGVTMVNAVNVIPLVPLEQNGTYVIAVLDGVGTASGEPFLPSFVWGLVRQTENPVTVENGQIVAHATPLDPTDPVGAATLLGVDLLWNAHASVMAALDQITTNARDDYVIAWSFNTQTTTRPLDARILGTPAANLPTDGIGGPSTSPVPLSITTDDGTPIGNDIPAYVYMSGAFAQLLGGAGTCGTAGNGICEEGGGCAAGTDTADCTCFGVGCFAVGDVYLGEVSLTQYQAAMPNGMTAGDDIPGPWTDPVAPSTTGAIGDEAIQTLIVTPCTSAPPAVAADPTDTGCRSPWAGAPPANGFPVVIFGHGITRSKSDLMAIASQFAKAGIATVAIDWVAHGNRAVRTSEEVTEGCDGTQDPTDTSASNGKGGIKCFAPAFSTELASTRDNFRQTMLDVLGVKEAIKGCTASASCGDLEFDSSKIGYIGHSLGAILGGAAVASSGDFAAAVLSVGGVGWGDLMENTGSSSLRCQIVDGLVEAGVLAGLTVAEATLAGDVTTALCLETAQTWKTQPGWSSFVAIARWILDPADPANYIGALATHSVLIQEVANDQVVPNISTDRQAALVGLATPIAATEFAPASATEAPTPTAALLTNPTDAKWVLYSNIASNGSTTPGNTYDHGSLLAPATDLFAGDGQAGTAQMQADAIYYLAKNLGLLP